MVIQKTIPQTNELLIKIPSNLVGKEIEIDIKEVSKSASEKFNVRQLRGKVSKELASEMLDYVKKSREEWSERIS